MDEKFMSGINEIVKPLLDNVYIYFFFSILLYFLGGIDESLVVLFSLNIIDIIICLLSKTRSNKNLFTHKIKIYLVIMLGVMLDKVLGIDNNTITRARTYIILAYSYNEIASIVNTLCLDETFYLPKGVRSYVEKLKKKENEYDEQGK